MSNPHQEPPASSKASNQDIKDMDVLCILKIIMEPKFGIILVYQRSRSRFQYLVRNLQCPHKDKSGFIGHRYYLKFKNMCRQSKF